MRRSTRGKENRAYDLSVVIDGEGTHGAGSGRYGKRGHLPAGEEELAGGTRIQIVPTDNLPRIVDCNGACLICVRGSQIRHFPIAVEEGVKVGVGEIPGSNDLAGIIHPRWFGAGRKQRLRGDVVRVAVAEQNCLRTESS